MSSSNYKPVEFWNVGSQLGELEDSHGILRYSLIMYTKDILVRQLPFEMADSLQQSQSLTSELTNALQ